MELIEIWKPLFNGYEISNTGYIYNTKTDRILNQRLDKDGYYNINLDYEPLKDGIRYRKTYRVNRLVALTFIENPNNYLQCHHIDDNRTNNNVDNLAWVTASKNNSLKSKRKGELTSKYVGIVCYKRKKGLKYRALLYQNGKCILDNTVATEEEALKLRNDYIINNNLLEFFKLQ